MRELYKKEEQGLNPIAKGGDNKVKINLVHFSIVVAFRVKHNDFLLKELKGVKGVKKVDVLSDYDNDYDCVVRIGSAFTQNEVSLAIKECLEKLGYDVTIN